MVIICLRKKSIIMAIIVKTEKPEYIVERIREKIDDGEIITWTYDEDGDFTHTGQWHNKAWFSMIYDDDSLTFYIVGRKDIQMELREYSIFHGFFVELLLNHFSQEISNIEVKVPLEHPADCSRINL